MAIRLIGLDIDGTLLDSKWELPEANRRAVGEAVARGIEVVVVTGRRFDFALPVAKRFGCPLTMIVSNGALVKTPEGVTHLRHLLPRAAARRILEATRAFRSGAAVVFDRVRENQVIFESIDWENEERRSYFERNRSFIAELSPLEDCLIEDPIQVMFTGPVLEMREAKRRMEAADGSGEYRVAITEYEHRNFSIVDAVNAAASKGAALAEWARRQGYAREEVMAIGDNHNDIEMLEYAGLAVVMGNSVPELKQMGWAVTGTADDAGVAEAIERFTLK